MPLELSDLDLLWRFLVAIGIGGLIGLERERHHTTKSVAAGVRTMPIVAVSGVLTMHLTTWVDATFLVPAALLVVGALAWRTIHGDQEMLMGTTTAVTIVAVFLLGLVAGSGQLFVAVAVAIGIAFLLFYKDHLHQVAGVLTEQELRGALYFAVFAFILFPIAPEEPIDPWGILEVRRVVLIVVLVSAITFAGFLVMRRFGPRRGLPLTGLFGGLVSSVAAAGALVSTPTPSRAVRRSVVQGVLLAAVSMVGRNIAVVVVADPSLQLAKVLALPLLVMGVVLGGGALFTPGKQDAEEEAGSDDPVRVLEGIKSPFAIGPAVTFGGMFLVLSVLATLLQRIPGIGDAGVYITAIGGLVSSGAVLASMALLLGQGSVSLSAASVTCMLAVVASLAVKGAVSARGDRILAGTWSWLSLAAGVGIVTVFAVLL